VKQSNWNIAIPMVAFSTHLSAAISITNSCRCGEERGVVIRPRINLLHEAMKTMRATFFLLHAHLHTCKKTADKKSHLQDRLFWTSTVPMMMIGFLLMSL